MNAPKESKPANARENQTTKRKRAKLARFFGVGSAGLASAALTSLAVSAQERANIAKGEQDHSASNPGPGNKPLLDENPASNLPPPTDYGNILPVWYSFDLPHMRIEEGGWTNQVTETQM
jgi:oxalate decarboxylase